MFNDIKRLPKAPDHINILGKITGDDRKNMVVIEYKDIRQEAIEQIYMATKGDMRKFKEICTDCRDRAKELKHAFVDINLALEFIADLPPQ